MKKSILIISTIIALIIGFAGGHYYFKQQSAKDYQQKANNINNFEECAKYWPVQESYPATCRANGKTFTQKVSNPPATQVNPNITVTLPQPNTQVSSPLTITGQAKGLWYFEASFPVKLYDANNNLIAQGVAQAQNDWMTTNFVPFTVTLTFPTPSTTTGTLILEKDNPSGEPQNADSISIPVNF